MRTIVKLDCTIGSKLLKKMFQTAIVDTTHTIDPFNDTEDPLYVDYEWLVRELLNNYYLAIGVEKSHQYKWNFSVKLKTFPSGLMLGTIRIEHSIMNDTGPLPHYYDVVTEFTFHSDAVVCKRLSDYSVRILATNHYITGVDFTGILKDIITLTVPGGFYIDRPLFI